MKVVLASHVWVTGPCHEFKKYFIYKKIETLLYITHPLMYHTRLNGSGYELYRNGNSQNVFYNKIHKMLSIVTYISAVVLNIKYVLNTKKKYDIYIGFNNLNALAGIVLRKIGKVKKCIFYVVDYTPRRFENNFLNFIYHRIESFCAIHCDETWNLSGKMVEAREQFKGLKREVCNLQKVVPMGIWSREIKRYDFRDIKKTQLVFMGHILKKNGVHFVLDAIPLIVEKVPNFKFVVIGDGDYLRQLKDKVKELEIEQYVDFMGYIKDHGKVEQIIAQSALSIALYEKGDRQRNWTYYTDPGKIKVYLGTGCPVLLTDVPPNAKEIEQNNCGKIVELNPESIAAAVLALMVNSKVLKFYRENALEYIKKFDWEKMLNEALIFDNNNLKGNIVSVCE